MKNNAPNNTSTNEVRTNEKTTHTTSIDLTSMELRQLHSSQQEAMKKINEFSGESNESDIDEWLYDLTNLFSLMKLQDETKILLTMGKLIGSALRWYQENLVLFGNWEEAEEALRDRFKTFTSAGQLVQEFFQLRQEEGQSITTFYDIVIRKYRKADGLITTKQIITVLQAGVKHSLKEQLIRNEVNISKPEEWLIMAREEEHIQRRLQQRSTPSRTGSHKPYFDSTLPTATIHYKTPTNLPSEQHIDKPQHRYHKQPYADGNNRTYSQRTDPRNTTQRSTSCLICNRTNHSTMKCFYKKEDGCFRCGQSTHRIRDCPQRYFFE